MNPNWKKSQTSRLESKKRAISRLMRHWRPMIGAWIIETLAKTLHEFYISCLSFSFHCFEHIEHEFSILFDFSYDMSS